MEDINVNEPELGIRDLNENNARILFEPEPQSRRPSSGFRHK